MRIKLLFCNIQKWQKHCLSLLIIFFMTVSSFGQSDGIDFECVGAGSITFGIPDGTFNGKTSWSNGVDFNGTPGYTLRFELDNTWSVRDPNGPRFFFSNVDINGLPSCDSADWERDLAANGQFCGGVVVTCAPPSDPDNDGDGFPASVDCNDNDPTVNAPITYYLDADGDGFGTTPADFCSSTVPAGYSTVDGDCNDGDAAINPDATEVCDGIDNNCDGNVDEGLTFTTYYVDSDGDGFGDEADAGTDFCSDPGAGFSLNNTDCDDTNPAINPDATEIPDDGIDQDCDGVDDTTATNDFVIVAQKKVDLFDTNTVTGNVGATEVDGKVKLQYMSNVSGSAEAAEIIIDNTSSAGSTILSPAVVNLPPFVFNEVSKNSNVNIIVEAGQTVTLDDQIYRRVKVRHGGTAIFTNSNVYLKRLKTFDDATVEFQNGEGCTNLFINKKVKMRDNTSFNPSGTSVTMYVDDKVVIEEGSSVTSYVYANKFIKAKGQSDNRTNMTGFFSGKRVFGEENVSWVGQTGYVPCDIVEPDETGDDSCECKQGMVSLTFAYTGIYPMLLTTNSGYIIDNYDGTYTVYNDGYKLRKNLEISDGDIDLDDDLDDDEGDDDDDYGSSSFATIHTSCSEEILGVTYDGVFTVISHTDVNGSVCETNVNVRSNAVNAINSGIEAFSGFEVKVWPNPSVNNFNVRVTTLDSASRIDVQVIDITGKRIHSDTIKWNNEYEFGDQLQAGIYFVKITQADKSRVLKVIKR